MSVLDAKDIESWLIGFEDGFKFHARSLQFSSDYQEKCKHAIMFNMCWKCKEKYLGYCKDYIIDYCSAVGFTEDQIKDILG